MTLYPMLKHVHVTAVALSGLGFALRGFWMVTESPRLRMRAVRIVPHVVDTVLLASALALAVVTSQYPFVQPWLTAKLIGLVVYIVLGTLALRRGRTREQRTVCLVLALLTFIYIVSVALRRDPLGPLAGLF